MENSDKPSSTQELTNKQVKYLRGLGHKLSPLVLIGKEGISDNLIAAIHAELLHHELIKVKVGNNSSVDKKEAARHIPEVTKSYLVQFIGKTLLIYKPNPERRKDKRIVLPNI